MGDVDFHSCLESANTAPDNAPTTAREKFGTQKGIGSDEFFGRAQFDPSAQTEARSRLQGFDGATSISSNAYFGRPEEDMPAGEYGDMETAAKDFIRQFGITAGDDLENVTQLVGEGARQLRGMSIFVCGSYLHANMSLQALFVLSLPTKHGW